MPARSSLVTPLDPALLGGSDQSVATAEVVADQADGGIGLLGDVRDPQLCFARGVSRVADRGGEQSLAALCGASIGHCGSRSLGVLVAQGAVPCRTSARGGAARGV